MGVPCIFIGMYGIAGILTGQKLVAGFLGAVWSYMAVAGMYELNRRKFNWLRGSGYSDQHLLAGSLAASTGLMLSGAVHETMPALVIIPALSAVKQASDGHETKFLTMIHAGLLVTGIGVGIWFYIDGIIGSTLLDRIVAMP